MAYTAQPRGKDHWSMRLRVKRPGRVRIAALVVAVVQTLLLIVTASSLATGGGLYGCTSACGTTAEPTTPAIAVIFGIVMLILPLVIGALSETWPLAVALAVLPVFPALIISGNALVTPTNTVVPPTHAKGTQPAVPFATSHFGPPFWLDAGHVTILLFAFALFALLG